MRELVQGNFKRTPLAVSLAAVVALALPATAVSESNDTVMELDIKGQKIGPALMELGQRADVQIIIQQGVGNSVELSPLTGSYTLTEALNRMLEGSGLKYEFTSDGVVAIKAVEPEADEEAGAQDDKDVDEEVVVTGSRIARNASEMAANVIILDADALRASGESTLEGALRRLPQNMFGASEVAAAFSGNPFNGALNITGGSSINLRGLGNESTLVLVNSRRIGKSGVFGGVSDISGIPPNSVERVEIMLDGASAIYGSDAVGGVVNIILKKDYDGVTASYEYGKPEDGGFEEHVFSVAGTTAWDSGNLSVDFERFQRSNLDGDERTESVQTAFGWTTGLVAAGTPLFYIYNGQRYLPSELPVPFTDPGVQGISSAVLPNTQTGNPVSLSDITIFSSNTFLPDTGLSASEGISLIPSQQRSNLQLRFDQALSENIDIGASLYYSDRNTYAGRGAFSATVSNLGAGVAGNPFENSLTSILFRLPDLADQHNETEQTVTRWTVYVNGELGDNWRWETAVGQSRDKIDSLYVNSFNFTAVPAAIADGLQLFTGDIVGDNSLEVLSQLVAPDAETVSVNKESTFDFRTSGELFRLPGGSVNVAAGVEWRQESLESRTETGIRDSAGLNFSLPFGAFDTADLDAPVSTIQRSAFTELLLPLVGADNAFTAVQQLILTGAARYDSYDNLGSDSTWSLGLVWSPIEQVRLKLRQSTSFVAPTPREKLIPVNTTDNTIFFPGGFPVSIEDPAGNIVGFDFLGTTIAGGNPDLEAETATSSTATVEVTPDFLPGLRLSVGWHETEYRNRITPPPFQFSVPAGVDYVAENPIWSRGEDGLLIADRRATNVALLYQSGVDYQLYYTRDTDIGEFYVTANIAATSNYEVIQFPGEPRVSRLERGGGEMFQQMIIPAHRYSTNLGWNHRGFSVNLTANTSSAIYNEVSSQTGNTLLITDAPWNLNLTMSYDMGGGDLFTAPQWLSDSRVSFRVLNLLDDYTQHSIVDTDTGMPVDDNFYTSGLADPRGRMLYIALSKEF